MNKKAIFLDADGTITDIVKGVPQSARDAVHEAQQNGHLVFLCTGRCRAMVEPQLVDVGFDGIIAAAGAYLERQGKVLYNKEVTQQEACDAVDILRRHGMVPVMEGAEFMYYDKDEYTDEVDWYASRITEMLDMHWMPIKGNQQRMYINKISAKCLPGCDMEGAIKELDYLFDPIVHTGGMAGGTVELVPKGYSKALGIAVACRLFGIAQEDTICFGDSNNDLEMFNYVHTKVAMGNSSEAILKKADYITTDMFHYGIRNGFRHLGLIE